MKSHVTLIWLLVLQIAVCQEGYIDESVLEAPYYKSYLEADAAWERAAFEQKDAEAAAQAYSKLEEVWSELPKFVQDDRAHYYSRSAVTTAKLLVQTGQFEDAFNVLQGLGHVATTHPAAPSHGKSATAFQELAGVHAEIMAAIGRDPLKGASVGYEWAKHENGFSAIQQDLDVNRGGPQGVVAAVEDLEDSETTATLLLFDLKGELIETVPVAVDRPEGRRGSLLERVTTAYKLVSDGGPRRPVRAPIGEFLSKVGKIDSNGLRPTKSSGSQKSTSPNGSPTSVGKLPEPTSSQTGKWMWLAVAAGMFVTAILAMIFRSRFRRF